MRTMALMALAGMLAACGDGQAAKAGASGATASPGAARPQPPSGQQKFRDWLAVCDNVGACHAFGPATDATGWVRISMEAGPDSAPGVAFGFWPQTDEDIVDPVTTTVDGATFDAVISSVDDGPPVAVVAPDRAAALVDAMAQGTAMSVSAGGQTVSISLTGAAAALLWIDERQGRLNTTTALMRKGLRPASAVPAAPARPRIDAAPAVSQTGYGDQEGQTLPAGLERLPAVIQCRDDTAFNPDLQKVISSARLDADTVLWSVPCGSGAYNSFNAFFTTTPQGTDPRQVAFPRVTGEPDHILVNAAYDPTTRVVDAFNKGRGPGDCGLLDSWVWTARGFVLKSSSEMSECWGVPSDYWPTSWVSQ